MLYRYDAKGYIFYASRARFSARLRLIRRNTAREPALYGSAERN